MNIYRTVNGEAFGEFVEKHSRFICYGKHVKTKSDAENYIDSIKSKHWNAKHNVYAYSIKDGALKKCSDDGEPKGTAGAPVLARIDGLNLKDIVIVVTRYFGGVLLGTGGLVRAYSHGAEVAIDACGIVDMKYCIVAEVQMSYDIFGKTEGFIRELGAVIGDCKYTDQVKVLLYVEECKFAKIQNYINEISSGKSKINVKGKRFFPCRI